MIPVLSILATLEVSLFQGCVVQDSHALAPRAHGFTDIDERRIYALFNHGGFLSSVLY
jgi:hypothetical protein